MLSLEAIKNHVPFLKHLPQTHLNAILHDNHHQMLRVFLTLSIIHAQSITSCHVPLAHLAQCNALINKPLSCICNFMSCNIYYIILYYIILYYIISTSSLLRNIHWHRYILLNYVILFLFVYSLAHFYKKFTFFPTEPLQISLYIIQCVRWKSATQTTVHSTKCTFN
jgi:hypothetical protein